MVALLLNCLVGEYPPPINVGAAYAARNLMTLRSRILLIVGGFTACIVLIAARGLWELG